MKNGAQWLIELGRILATAGVILDVLKDVKYFYYGLFMIGFSMMMIGHYLNGDRK